MGSSDISAPTPRVRSYVQVKQSDEKSEKSEGEIDDSDDDSYHRSNHEEENANNNESNYRSRSDIGNKYNNSVDKERSYKRDRYSDDSDNERCYRKRTKRTSREDYDDFDKYDYGKSNRRYERSSRHDKYDYDQSSSRRDDDRAHKKDRRRYVDLDEPHDDEDNNFLESRKIRGDKDRIKDVRKDVIPSEDKGAQKDVTSEVKGAQETKRKLTVGAYIPPSKLRAMQAGITNKSSKEYQRMSWEALKKSINGLVNKVNTVNIQFIVEELIRENIVRGRGLVAQTIIRAQVASPTFTSVYASLVNIINTKFPKIAELILRRLIIQFRKSYKRNDKRVCINSAKFIAHLVNQQTAHELLALEILTLLLHNHTPDSVEVAVSFLKEVGQKLLEVSPKGVNAVFESLRNIIHDSQTDKRVQYMVEVIFHSRKDNFREFPIIPEGLDHVDEEDQITHLLRLDDDGNGEDVLNVFKFDPDYIQNEEKYNEIKKSVLPEDSEDSSGDDDDDDDGDDDDDDNEEADEENSKKTEIIDMTQTNMTALRKKVFLTIQSCVGYEECAHKMMRIELKEGQHHEFCLMVVEACAMDRSYQKFFGLLAHRFCLLRREFMAEYVIIFREQYENSHHLSTNKLRNTATLFGQLLWSDGIPWSVLECMKLTEEETTSSSRIFIKILFEQISEFLGITKLLDRLKDPSIQMYVEGLFPRDHPKNIRFSINFFTAIGLGVLTDDLREHLKTMPKVSTTVQKMAAAAGLEESSSSSSSESSSSSDSSDSSSGSSSSESSDSEDNNGKNAKRGYKSSPRKKTKHKKSEEIRH